MAHKSHAQDEKVNREMQVVMRMIGDEILRLSGDSSSRVLPIKRVDDRYRISFETEFSFSPEELSATVDEVIKESKLVKAYIVEVEQCESEEIVYSYVIRNLGYQDIIPCRGRGQPLDCYSVLLTILDPEESLTQKNSNSLTDSSLENASGFRGGKDVTTISLIVFLSLIVIGFLYFRKKAPESEETDNPHLISLGKYRFDKRTMELSLGGQVQELTSKEADLLSLLYSSANETLKREEMLNKVWGDEGDYIGRTLDVFISKLRKKLEADSTVKIVNVRGIGYKLVLRV
ncbi:MAG: response regulator transcription factor [Bacteroidia bacterium]|nr:response regulator transcription factor [Bacteroidia bacterium]